MSFPDLLVKVRRHCNCRVIYRDLGWNERSLPLSIRSRNCWHNAITLMAALAVARATDSMLLP
jgi:hypothetical protein